MSVRAKFKCTSITIHEGESREYSFAPVYGADGSANADWSKWTPNGSLKMTINNPACFDKFETGKEYYLDFTPAESAIAAEAGLPETLTEGEEVTAIGQAA